MLDWAWDGPGCELRTFSQQQPLSIPVAGCGTFSAAAIISTKLQRGNHSFLPGLTTETLGINGNYLGPTLRFKRNERVAHAGE